MQCYPVVYLIAITHLKVSIINKYLMASEIKESSTNSYNLKLLKGSCDVNETLRSISSRWKMQVLHSISINVRQFGQLKKAFPSLSEQVLGKRLGELVTEGLVNKVVLPHTVPTQIKYTITTKGTSLLSIMMDLHLWGKHWNHKTAI